MCVKFVKTAWLHVLKLSQIILLKQHRLQIGRQNDSMSSRYNSINDDEDDISSCSLPSEQRTQWHLEEHKTPSDVNKEQTRVFLLAAAVASVENNWNNLTQPPYICCCCCWLKLVFTTLGGILENRNDSFFADANVDDDLFLPPRVCCSADDNWNSIAAKFEKGKKAFDEKRKKKKTFELMGRC